MGTRVKKPPVTPLACLFVGTVFRAEPLLDDGQRRKHG